MDTFEALVKQERQRQDKKWGEQNHHPFIWLVILGEEYGELQKACLEEYFEEFYHPQEGAIETELIQVVAVAKAMWECIKRNPKQTSKR